MPAAVNEDRRVRRLTAAAATAVLAAIGAGGVGGCYYPGGPGFSADRFTYESTTWQPWTVTLEDTRTGQAFWSMEVPVGYQLVIDFDEGPEGTADEFTPDTMKWELMPIGRRSGELDNTMRVPPASARLLVPTLRRTPELPDDMVAAQGGPPPVRVLNPENRSGAGGAEGQVGGQ